MSACVCSKFERVTNYPEAILPTRATSESAGYDFYVAEDIIIPAYEKQRQILTNDLGWRPDLWSLNEVAKLTKERDCKPTLVPTGVKCYLANNHYLQLSLRSSCPLKYWLILANGVGIIDKDYYNNPDNEGHIYFQIINLFPFDIVLYKGDKIGQGVILPYATAGELYEKEHAPAAARTGGFGSTGT